MKHFINYFLLFSFFSFYLCQNPVNYFTSNVVNNIKNIPKDKFFFKFPDQKTFIIIKLITCGGIGCIYLIADKSNLKVQKILKLQFNKDNEQLKEFKSQANICNLAQQIMDEQNKDITKCPNILKIRYCYKFPIGLNIVSRAIVFDYIDGNDMSEFISNLPSLSTSNLKQIIIKIFIDIMEGTKCLHDFHQRLHLDLKPQNVMIEKSTNRAIIIDIDSVFLKIKVGDENFGMSEYYAPYTDDELLAFDETYKDPAKKYSDLYDTWDHFTIGEIFCETLLTLQDSIIQKPNLQKLVRAQTS